METTRFLDLDCLRLENDSLEVLITHRKTWQLYPDVQLEPTESAVQALITQLKF